MKASIILSIFILFTIFSCNNSQTQEKPKEETPKALDNESSLEIVSKRGSDDLMESLYDELADKTPELKELERRLDNLAKSKDDSTELFDDYNRKNLSYFNAANKHLEQISDSVLRDKMKALISASLTKYNSKILQHNSLLKSIDTNTVTLNELHTVLKITRTLPLIEKYQNDNLPATKPIEGFLKQLDETIKYADTLVKK